MSFSISSIIRSNRRTISLSIDEDGSIVIKAPKYTPDYILKSFVNSHKAWIEKKLQKIINSREKIESINYDIKNIPHYKVEIRKKMKEKLDLFSKKHGFKYTLFRLSNAGRRWGSCTSKGVISLNWRLYFVPDEVLDYVIFHELMHLKHLNHSKNFWRDLEKILPDYKKRKKWLNENGVILSLK